MRNVPWRIPEIGKRHVVQFDVKLDDQIDLGEKMQPIEILREDFAQTFGFIDKCDEHIFKIKNWALLTSSAVIAFSISQKHDILALANLALLLSFT